MTSYGVRTQMTINQAEWIVVVGGLLFCSCLSACCTSGQFDTRQVDMSKASTISSLRFLSSFLLSTLNQVGEAELGESGQLVN